MTEAEALRTVRAAVDSTRLDRMLLFIESKHWQYSLSHLGGEVDGHHAKIEVPTERDRDGNDPSTLFRYLWAGATTPRVAVLWALAAALAEVVGEGVLNGQ